MFNGPIDFGLTLTNAGIMGIANTTMTVQVTSGVNYTIALDVGLHGSVGVLRLRIPNNLNDNLDYILYSDNGNTLKWGDGNTSLGNGALVLGTGAGSAQTLTVYAKGAGNNFFLSNPVAGNYSDTVTATLTY